jgi:hypothetical protein
MALPNPVAEGQGAKKAAKGGVIEIGEGKDGKFRSCLRARETSTPVDRPVLGECLV